MRVTTMMTHLEQSASDGDSWSPPPRWAPGYILMNKYQLEKELGRGAYGIVFKASHLDPHYPVAIKLPQVPWLDFRKEAETAQKMDSQHLVRFMDYGVDHADKDDDEDGIEYLVMEYIDGYDVQRWIEQAGRLNPLKALAVTRDMLVGLVELHRHGILHRDVKPQNVLIRREDMRVKLSDFGLAVPEKEAARRPFPVGTPPYMAPELWQGGNASVASDIFAVGVSLFQMLSGKLPWHGASSEDLPDWICNRPPLPLAKLAIKNGLPTQIESFIQTCLEKNPKDRWKTAAIALKQIRGMLKTEKESSRLLPNRVAIVAGDDKLAKVLVGALRATSVLTPLAIAKQPNDPALQQMLGKLDAIVLDPECAPATEIEAFVAKVRAEYTTVVFFLLVKASRWSEIRKRFSDPWRKRFGHFFVLLLDQSLAELPAEIDRMATAILFDQTKGRSMATATK